MERRPATNIKAPENGSNHVHRKAAGSSGSRLHSLEHSIGNYAIQQIIRSPFIQTKLQVSTPGDPLEQEADRTADKVMREPVDDDEERSVQRKSLSGQITPVVQRELQLPLDDDKNEKANTPAKIQRVPLAVREDDDDDLEVQKDQTHGSCTPAPSATRSAAADIRALSSGGSPLSNSTRAFFEPRLGADFSKVRVHSDSKAAETAASLNARAFTHGDNIAFAASQFAPESSEGKRLLAHELVHTIQQGASPASLQQTGAADGEMLENRSTGGISSGVSRVVQRQVVKPEPGGPPKGKVFPPDIVADTSPRQKIQAITKRKYLWQAAQDIEELVKTGGHKEATYEERLWMIELLMGDNVTASNLNAQLALWQSFGNELLQIAGDNLELSKRSYERGIISRLELFKTMRETFERDVKMLARDYLKKNSSLILGEKERFGLAGSARAVGAPITDVAPQREQALADIQSAATKTMQAQKAMNDLMTVPVGYYEGMGRRVVTYFPDQPPPKEHAGEVSGHFDGDGVVIDYIPGEDAGLTTSDYPIEKFTMLSYEGVHKVHETLREEMAKFTNAYPAIYAAIQADKLDDLATGGPQEALKVVQSTLTTVEDNILKTYPKLEGDSDFWYKLKPIHDQLGKGIASPSGTAWNDPLHLFVAEQMVKKYEKAEFWKDLGLNTLAAAAFVVAELATAGGATFFIAAAIGTGITTYQVYKSWDEYFTLAQTADTEVNEELQLVYPGQVAAALLGAILQTAFSMFDVAGPVMHWAKAARRGLMPAMALKGVAAAEVKGIEALARRVASKEISEAEAKAIVEKAVAELGVGGAARRAGVEPQDLLRYVDRDSEAGRRISDYAKSSAPGEGPSAIKTRGGRYHGKPVRRVVREATDDYPEGLVHYGLSDTEAAASYEKSVFEDPTREAGIWRDLDSGEHVAVQGGEDFVTAKWMNDAEFAGKRWHLVEHFQPTSASKLERYASVEDYDALMKPYWGRNPPVEPPGPISSTIRWHDARTGKPRYTTFGYNPAAEEPFWIEFLDPSTKQMRREHFDAFMYPRVGPDYRPFLDEEAKKAGISIDWSNHRDPGVPVDWANIDVQRPSVGETTKAVTGTATKAVTQQLKKLASLAPKEAETVLSQAIEELGPAEALKQAGMDWKTLSATLPKPSEAGRKLLHWRDTVLGDEIKAMFPESAAMRTGTKGSFENDFDWNFLGTEAVENRAKVISFLSGRTGMTPEEMRKLLAADFFTDPRRMFLYERLPAGMRDRVARRQAEIERQLIWNGELSAAVAKGDKALEQRIRGQMQRLGVPEAKGGVKMLSPEDIRVAESEIDEFHKQFEDAMKKKDYAIAEQRATQIADRQAQINAASGGAYVSYGGVRKFAVEREPELAITLEGEEMLQPGWYTVVLDQMPHMRHAIEQLEEATTKGDMAAAMRSIGKYGDRMTSMANLGLAKTAVGKAAFDDLEFEFKMLYARSKIAANDVASLQGMLAKDLEGTMTRVRSLLDELEKSSEEVLASLQKSADVDVLFEEVQLFLHLHIKFLKLQQATYWQMTTILKALRQGTLPEGWG